MGGKAGKLRIALTLSVSAALVLSGCATPGPENYSKEIADGGPAVCNQITEDDINVDTAATTAEGAAVWAALGAGLLALLGAASGANGGQVATLAGVGAGAGAVAGGVSGYNTAQQKKQFALQEARLDCQLQAAKEDNEKLDGLLAELNKTIDANKKELEDLQAQYNAKEMTKGEAQEQLASIDATTAAMEQAIADMKQRKQEYEAARDANNQAANETLNTAELDKNIADLNQKIAQADAALQSLVDKRKVAQIG